MLVWVELAGAASDVDMGGMAVGLMLAAFFAVLVFISLVVFVVFGASKLAGLMPEWLRA